MVRKDMDYNLKMFAECFQVLCLYLAKIIENPLHMKTDLTSSPWCSRSILCVSKGIWPFKPQWWQASNFSLQYHYMYLIKHIGHENKDDDHQRCNVLMFMQILPTSTINRQRTVRRICMLILGLRGLIITLAKFWLNASKFPVTQPLYFLKSTKHDWDF